ncbi:DmsC/YnfH family molybdoenzyme membrane anchor subunit [Citrobacter portucalensis]|nr:DmsC/YnfH family molybdoenzyme membrane anchor subunit [Citrobacter portucalensis]MEB1083525.1 DmsC/YnfH family molybdoenzyme membrane anchor subunit [Citrobacter portucalensis]
MEHFELPLVFFTVMTQWGIGALLAVVIGQQRTTPVFTLHTLKRVAVFIWLVTVIGSLASIAHLGAPTGAPRALYGLAHSWLSREVVAFFLLNALVTLWVLMVWINAKGTLLVGLVAVLAGIAAILVSSQVYYQMILHPLWHSPATQLAFIGCALLLGFVSVAVLANVWGTEVARRLQAGVIIGVAVVACALVWRYRIAGADAASVLLWWQLLASIVIGVVVFAMLRHGRLSVWSGVIAIALVFTGEIAGRMLFYSNVMNGAPWF